MSSFVANLSALKLYLVILNGQVNLECTCGIDSVALVGGVSFILHVI